jgi:hypothetical protein
MESLVLTVESQNQVNDYLTNNHLMPYERSILNEIMTAATANDDDKLAWFSCFGDSFRAITMNVNAYRKGLEFGFTEIAFDQYGWFKRPEWSELEELAFGDTSRYGNYSTITLGHGPHHNGHTV